MLTLDGFDNFVTPSNNLEYDKEHEVGDCHQLCLLLVDFVVSTLKQALRECKTFDFQFCRHTISCCIQKKET